jgi:glyoxylase-like metal-dependent hydrolase (beta-lactamase superfamily II)
MTYTLHPIETGQVALDGGAMFGIVPKPLWERRIAADARNRIPLALRCLLAQAGDRLVLIDTGVGDKIDAKFADIYGVDHSRHTLQGSLRAAGFDASDVTDVVLTHLHFDHCGGATVRQPDGTLGLAFPNAQVHVQRDHWTWATRDNKREQASFLAENLEPLEQSGHLVQHDGEGEILPGIRVRTADGHTRAQQIVLLDDADGTVAFPADLLPTHHHLAPAWTMGYDVLPMTSMDEKAALLADAIAGDWRVLFEHDVDMSWARIEQTERGPRAVSLL